MSKKVIIGTRGSKLALWQANFVANKLKSADQELEVEIKTIKTKGDKILDVSLAKIGGKGLFVKEIELALIRGEVDLAVHSMKDLPTEIPEELKLGAILERDDPRDALISKDGLTLAELPQASRVGTSSLRRQAQLLNWRADFTLVDVRGNLDTRIRKMKEGQFEAIIVSSAGVDRMGWQDLITERIPPDILLPAVGQGTIAVEVRTNDDYMTGLTSIINHRPTQLAILAERALMRRLEGGCQVPVGALGKADDDKLELQGIVASLDGKRLLKDSIQGASAQAESLGTALADKLLAQGADEILKEIRAATDE